MTTQVPLIGRPNYRAIAGMDNRDVVRAREFYIVKLVTARRGNDSDTMEACIDWIVALTGEMRMRGGSAAPPALVTL